MENELMTYRATGKSVDEAIFKGIREMGISIDEVTIEIIQHETKGILGIGAKPAIVLLTQKPEDRFDIPDYLKDDRRREGKRNDRDRRDRREDKPADKKQGEKKFDKPYEKKQYDRKPEKPEKAAAPEKPEAKPENKGDKNNKKQRPERKPQAEEKPEKPASFERAPEKAPEKPEEKPVPPVFDEPEPEDMLPARRPDDEAPAKQLVYTLEAAENEPAAQFVQGLIEHMGAKGRVLAAQDEDCLRLRIDSEMMGMLIGHRGETLDAMQYLTGLAVNRNRKTEGYKRITLNTEEYREKREETLKRLAKKVAAQVRATGRPRALEPMNPYERRVLHSTLQNNPDVTTHSEGEEPNRRVVVTPRKLRGKGEFRKAGSKPRRNERKPVERRSERRPAENADEGVISREEYEKLLEAARKGVVSKEMYSEIAGGAKSENAAPVEE